MKDKLRELADCAECGMPCEPGEYHPYAACLMFKGCHNSATVRANLTQTKILDAEGDGGAVACGYLITWNDQTYRGKQTLSLSRCHEDDGCSVPVYTRPARSGVVSDEDAACDTRRLQFVLDHVPHSVLADFGVLPEMRDLPEGEAHIDDARRTIDAAIQGERHEC